MSGWIDPLGVRALYRFVQAEQLRLLQRIEEQSRLHPDGRRVARYRARYAELGRVQALIQGVERPGLELRPHKALVNQHPDRPDLIRAIDRPYHSFLQDHDLRQREAKP